MAQLARAIPSKGLRRKSSNCYADKGVAHSFTCRARRLGTVAGGGVLQRLTQLAGIIFDAGLDVGTESEEL